MERRLRHVSLSVLVLILVLIPCSGKDSSEFIKRHEQNTISLELEFTKRNPNAFQRVIRF